MVEFAPFLMIVMIVAIVQYGRIQRAKYGDPRLGRRGRRDQADDGDDRLLGYQDPAEAQRLRDEVRTLKERVAVLERIATDGNRSAELDREIEALRNRS